jgi:quinoprotein glucose dehydrogenase
MHNTQQVCDSAPSIRNRFDRRFEIKMRAMMKRRNLRPRAIAVLCTVALAISGICGAQSRKAPESAERDWPVVNGDAAADHYSTLSQINRENVHTLRLAWTYDTGETGGSESNPIIVNGVLYTYTPSQKVIALDAASGKQIWKFDSGIHSMQPARGVTYWTDGKESRIFATVSNFLYALDAATGKPILSFGEQGRVDLRKELRGDYLQQSITPTSPGIDLGTSTWFGTRGSEVQILSPRPLIFNNLRPS